jgi:membrane-bound lytic murein transglycosylase D
LKSLTKILILLFSLNVANCSSIKILSDTKRVPLESTETFLTAAGNGVELDYDSDKLIANSVSTKKYEHLNKYFKNDFKKNHTKTKEIKIEEKQIEKTITSNIVSLNRENKTEFSLKYNKKFFDFWINYFTKRDKERFIRHLNNGEKYKKLVMNIFEDEGLPKELYYVGLIESGYNSRIKSRAKATGYWQFMKGTGKNYGLKINRSVDERTNIHKSTLAAAQYFKDLYNIFGSWELALCAYNKGEYGIINAIRKGNTRNYHELVRKKLLPKETVYYIPKVMAAKFLSNNLKKLDVRSGQIQSEDTDFTSSKIYSLSGQTTLKKIAKDLGVSYTLIKKINRDFNYKTLRGTKRNPLRVILPLKENGNKLNINKVKLARITKSKHREYVDTGKKKSYKVRRGDNLSTIARKFGVRLNDLKYLNSLNKRGKILIGQRIKIPRRLGNFYTVRKGDNLTFIAKKFKISISRLLNLNGLKSGKIYPRQRLLIPGKG